MNYQSDHSKISSFWVLIDVSTSVYVYVLLPVDSLLIFTHLLRSRHLADRQMDW